MSVQSIYSVLLLVNLVPIGEAPRTPQIEELCRSITLEEQRAFIKILVCLEVETSEIYRQLDRALGDNAYSRRRITSLAQEFRDQGRTETCDLPRSGRPQAATCPDNQVQVQQILEEGENYRADDIAIRLGISHSSVLNILHDLDYHFVMPNWVSHRITPERMQQRVPTAMNNIHWLDEREDNLMSLIAIDETWITSNMPTYGQGARSWTNFI